MIYIENKNGLQDNKVATDQYRMAQLKYDIVGAKLK